MTHDDDYLVAKTERFGHSDRIDRVARFTVIIDRVAALHTASHDADQGDPDRPPWCIECGYPYPCRTARVLKRWGEL